MLGGKLAAREASTDWRGSAGPLSLSTRPARLGGARARAQAESPSCARRSTHAAPNVLCDAIFRGRSVLQVVPTPSSRAPWPPRGRAIAGFVVSGGDPTKSDHHRVKCGMQCGKPPGRAPTARGMACAVAHPVLADPESGCEGCCGTCSPRSRTALPDRAAGKPRPSTTSRVPRRDSTSAHAAPHRGVGARPGIRAAAALPRWRPGVPARTSRAATSRPATPGGRGPPGCATTPREVRRMPRHIGPDRGCRRRRASPNRDGKVRRSRAVCVLLTRVGTGCPASLSRDCASCANRACSRVGADAHRRPRGRATRPPWTSLAPRALRWQRATTTPRRHADRDGRNAQRRSATPFFRLSRAPVPGATGETRRSPGLHPVSAFSAR